MSTLLKKVQRKVSVLAKYTVYMGRPTELTDLLCPSLILMSQQSNEESPLNVVKCYSEEWKCCGAMDKKS